MQIIHRRERLRQIRLDKLQRSAKCLEADLDENARRILDVVPGGLHQSRRLSKLGQDTTGSFGRRRVSKDGLTRQAGRQCVRVDLRVVLPGPGLFELEHPRPDVVGHHGSFGFFGGRQAGGVNLLEPPKEAGQCADLRLDGGAAEVFEEVVMHVHTIQRRAGWMRLIQITKVVIDKVRKGFG